MLAMMVMAGCSGSKGATGATGGTGPTGTTGPQGPTDPTVSWVMPVQGATDVYIDSVIKVGFTKPMDSSTINSSTFSVSTGGIIVTGTISYDAGSQTAFFDPYIPLAQFGYYTATLTTGIKDTSANPLPATYTWSFIAGGSTTPSRLYVADSLAKAIDVFNNANSADGNLVPDRVITSGSFNWPWRIWLDKGSDRLYVANNNNTILVFDNASTMNGATLPSRTISSALFTQSAGIWVDTANNILYISDINAGAIYAFNNASTLNGAVTPSRIIWGSNTKLVNPENIWLDQATDELYVADGGANAILVFTDASTANGNATPSRTITSPDFAQATALWLDTTNDELYIGNYGGSSVLILNHASTLNGSVTPDRIISGTKTTFIAPYGLWVDASNDRLYVADFRNASIDVFDNASTINGNIAPSRVIAGANTGFAMPESIWLDMNP